MAAEGLLCYGRDRFKLFQPPSELAKLTSSPRRLRFCFSQYKIKTYGHIEFPRNLFFSFSIFLLIFLQQKEAANEVCHSCLFMRVSIVSFVVVFRGVCMDQGRCGEVWGGELENYFSKLPF